jgi:hypothetical protein
MGLIEVALALLILGVVVVWAIGRTATPAPRDDIDEVLGAAHDAIDEIELARVRSMLQRR